MSSHSKKRKLIAGGNEDQLRPPPPMMSSAEDSSGSGEGGRKIIVLLDKAVLETTKTKRNDFELLNCDDHRHIARKHNLDPSLYRPDILHQELLALIDSPLNKAGNLQIYIHTEKHVLIEVNPKVRAQLMMCNLVVGDECAHSSDKEI